MTPPVDQRPSIAEPAVRLGRPIFVLQLVDHAQRVRRLAGGRLPGKGADHPPGDGLTGLEHGYPVERVALPFAVLNLLQYLETLRSIGDLAAE
jgi:hypothetical protein